MSRSVLFGALGGGNAVMAVICLIDGAYLGVAICGVIAPLMFMTAACATDHHPG